MKETVKRWKYKVGINVCEISTELFELPSMRFRQLQTNADRFKFQY